MKWSRAVWLFMLVVLGNSCAFRLAPSGAPLHVDGLRCEYLTNPLGIDVVQPRLSWKLKSEQRGERQTAYRVVVASTAELLSQDRGDFWDSGKVESDESTQVVYAGKTLPSGARCFWKVRVWGKTKSEIACSEPATWSMGLPNPEDWKAKWIGLESPKENGMKADRRLAARYLRKEFAVNQTVKRAVVSVCGLGLFELQMNGRKVGDHVLEPALAEYDKRAFYETFDVTQQLKPGVNAFGVILGNGRFFAPRSPPGTQTFGFPKLLLQLDIEYADGAASVIVSDESWKVTTNGPIRANNNYDGEEYDDRLDMNGWSEPGFDDARWSKAQIVAPGAPHLAAQMIEPIRVTATLHPVGTSHPAAGIYIFDMGQNMVGWCRLKASGPAGTQITLRHAETLRPDGTLYVDNLRSAKATDVFTLKGGGEEVFEPRFAYHGFRYVEISGYPGEPVLANLEGRVVHDALPEAGQFSCSNPTLNQIERNIYWGVRGNYRSIPTDCPQRDERQGWMGDRSEESKGESYLFDVSAFYTKWLGDIQDSQNQSGSVPDVAPAYWRIYNDGVSWPSTYIIIPYVLYDQYGDIRILQTHYETMTKWIDYMGRFVSNGIINNNSYGDWCVPPESLREIHSKDPGRITDGALISTAYFYHDLCLMARSADLLRKAGDRQRFEKMAGEVKTAFNHRFFHPALGSYANGTQTSCILPLAYGLVPDGQRAAVFSNLVNNIVNKTGSHVGTGLIGCQWLMRVLSDNGRPDLAYTIATQTTYPSWGYMISKGATTIWELWNGDTADPAMNSGNHVMLVGDLNTWLEEYLAGIRPDPSGAGFKKILIKPELAGDLTWVKGSHESPYGRIVSNWKRDGKQFSLHLTIPPNTTATVFVPAKSPRSVTEGSRPAGQSRGVKYLRQESGCAVFEVESGQYDFESEISFANGISNQFDFN